MTIEPTICPECGCDAEPVVSMDHDDSCSLNPENADVGDIREAEFRDLWRSLSDLGACDSPGGMEHRRVHREWVAAGRPSDIEAFIRRRANIGPHGEEPGLP